MSVLERGLDQGKSLNDAGCAALLAMLAAETDTIMPARADWLLKERPRPRCPSCWNRSHTPANRYWVELDDRFIQKNLSPGGSADLLAVCYLLHFLRTEAF